MPTITSPPLDTSDPISYTCTCVARTSGGSVLLFYRYWANHPPLPSSHDTKTHDLEALAAFHRELASSLSLGGKFRIALEGFNITLGGTTLAVEKYIDACVSHWSFAGIDLSTSRARDAFFKPTSGCACAFTGKANVKVTAEITPLGITNYAPSTWNNVTSLSPAEFHDLCASGDIPLIDVRNHYESRIGYFVTSSGGAAVRPQVRRFSQWPGYVMRHVLGNELYQKPSGIATYCTGGIRCEKGARWMQEALAKETGNGEAPVYTLHGGIVAYQAWMDEEVRTGRKRPEESFFKGTNYVFDGRGAVGGHDAVSICHACGTAESRLGKCNVGGCHLVLVVCEACEERGGVTCCEDCQAVHEAGMESNRQMCRCEREREKSLWGEDGARLGQTKGRTKKKAAIAK